MRHGPRADARPVADRHVRDRLVEAEEAARRHLGRVEDALLHDVGVGLTGQLLDHQTENDEAGVGVLEALARRAVRRQVAEERQEVCRPGHRVRRQLAPQVGVVGEVGRGVLVLLAVVGDARGVAEQVVHRDRGQQRPWPAVRRQHVHDGGLECHQPVTDQADHRAGSEHLGDRRDAESGGRRDRGPGRTVGVPDAGLEDPLTAAGQQHRTGQVAGLSPRAQLVGQRLQSVRVRWHPASVPALRRCRHRVRPSARQGDSWGGGGL